MRADIRPSEPFDSTAGHLARGWKMSYILYKSESETFSADTLAKLVPNILGVSSFQRAFAGTKSLYEWYYSPNDAEQGEQCILLQESSAIVLRDMDESRARDFAAALRREIEHDFYLTDSDYSFVLQVTSHGLLPSRL